MRRSTVLAAGLLFCLAALGAGEIHAQLRAAPRPNIIVILADDMGYSDIGSYGSEIPTPHLDRLAREGMRFTRFYNTGRCVPTRAALMTGLYQHQAGLGHMTGDYGHPSYSGTLDRRGLTIAEALRSAGYRTYIAGKWHLGSGRGAWPLDRGFDRFYGVPSGGGAYFREAMRARERELVLDSTVIEPPADWYSTDAFTEHAVRFIREGHRSGAPFFLYLPHIAPHWPLQAHPEDIERHRGRYLQGWDAVRTARYERQKELGIVGPEWPLSPRDPAVPAWEDAEERDLWDLKMAVYAAMVARMDHGIGRVLETLDALGIADNTLVLFLSDNGASAEDVDRGRPGAPPGHPESYTSYDRPWANASNTPFRLYKSRVHEGGIATPLIARWPGIVPEGSLTREVGHVMDVMPTVLQIAGVRYPDTHAGARLAPVAGLSLLPVLRGGGRTGHEALFWEHEGNRAVRQGAWKLVSESGGGWELYDLDRDPTELRDLSASRPERVAELARLYEDWARRTGVLPWSEVQEIRRRGAGR